jgi:predicted ATPase
MLHALGHWPIPCGIGAVLSVLTATTFANRSTRPIGISWVEVCEISGVARGLSRRYSARLGERFQSLVATRREEGDLQFMHTTRGDRSSIGNKNATYLSWNSWDDFGFKTTFNLIVFDHSGQAHDLGSVRIMRRGQDSGVTPMPTEPFPELGDDYCSLGSGRAYYEGVRSLPGGTREDLLLGLRDCVFEPDRFTRFEAEPAMQTSLLRSATKSDAQVTFQRILNGDAALSVFHFSYNLFEAGTSSAPPTPGEIDSAQPPLKLEFRVQPRSKPSSNVHVLIGRNGVGKTRLLAGMADALSGREGAPFGLKGRFDFQGNLLGQSDFLNLVVVSFSVFDHFNPISEGQARTDKSVPYYYVGVKKYVGADLGDGGAQIGVKGPDDLSDDFCRSFSAICDDDDRVRRWVRAVQMLEGDSGIRDLGVGALIDDHASTKARILGQVATMSSGHKLILLTLTRLIEDVSDRSLVLLDEPETHLHPPLLGSFMRAFSELLVSRNGVAIVATHSPVVLQEVPSDCVWLLRKVGKNLTADRPDLETFAENVSVLTRKVFGLELEQSGFYRLLNDEAQGADYDDVMFAFKERIGTEGRALLRALTWKDE